MTADLAAAAAACHAAGITVHPVAGPGEGDRKRPYGRWGGKHHQPLALHVTQSLLSTGQHPGFGVICGRVSGHLEVVDIEGRAVPHRLDQVTAIAHDCGLGELFDRVLAGYCERTPSGGLHLLWRCPAGVSGNLKLAQAPGPPDDQGRPTVLTLVETRGEGGFCVVAPTPGYRLLAGGPDLIPVITAEERAALLALFRTADELPPRRQERLVKVGAQGDRPGDQFNATRTWEDVLAPHGWVYVAAGGRGEGLWRRPGKDVGWSATTDALGTGTLHVHSTSTPFATSPTSYSKFAAYTVLEHGGDFVAAARAVSNGPRLPDSLPATVAASGEIVTPPAERAGATYQDFWQAHELLTYIRDFARAARVHPSALLGWVIAEVLGRIEPAYVIPPLVGLSEGSLNTLHVMLGPSGMGKRLVYDAGRAVFHWGGQLDNAKPGTGEGLVDLFAYSEPDPDRKGRTRTEQHTTRMLLYAPEVKILEALMGRSGSTLLGALCEVYSGERLGYGYRGKDKSAQIPDHSYRLPVVIGAQPGNTSVFFDNVESGFPQRACWWQVYDQDLPDVAPECPHRRSWHIPQGELLGLERNRLTGRRQLNFCSQAWRDADAALVARHRAGPQADPWTSHDLQTRAKVAAGLALLFGGAEVTDEIWQLSAEPMRMSVATRDAARGALAAEAAQRNRQRGRAEGERAVVAQEAVEAAVVARVAQRIRVLLERADDWVGRADLHRKVAHRDRDYFEAAVEHLTGAGLVTTRSVIRSGNAATDYKIGKP